MDSIEQQYNRLVSLNTESENIILENYDKNDNEYIRSFLLMLMALLGRNSYSRGMYIFTVLIISLLISILLEQIIASSFSFLGLETKRLENIYIESDTEVQCINNKIKKMIDVSMRLLVKAIFCSLIYIFLMVVSPFITTFISSLIYHKPSSFDFNNFFSIEFFSVPVVAYFIAVGITQYVDNTSEKKVGKVSLIGILIIILLPVIVNIIISHVILNEVEISLSVEIAGSAISSAITALMYCLGFKEKPKDANRNKNP